MAPLMLRTIPRVIVETPFRGDPQRNLDYLKAALKDCIQRGEAPFASHALYTQVLDDKNPTEREVGMRLGFVWMAQADFVAVYTDLGISEGMRKGIEHAKKLGIPVEYRVLPEW